MTDDEMDDGAEEALPEVRGETLIEILDRHGVPGITAGDGDSLIQELEAYVELQAQAAVAFLQKLQSMQDADDSVLLDSIREHEGYSDTLYEDSMGFLTIGYGTNVSAGISERMADAMLSCQVNDVIEYLEGTYGWFKALTVRRQRAMIEMAYQLGPTGFSKFKKMIQAIRQSHWDRAADEVIDSRWHQQTPVRTQHVARLLRGG